jgi:uncharacterized protein (TIGR02246 family)
MNPSSLLSSIVIVLLAWTLPQACMAQGADDSAIRQVQAQQAEAWNRHDAHAYASLFTPDGDVVNVVGWWWQGRSEIEGKLTQAFAVMFRESKLSVADVKVRFLTPEVALAHVRWTMTGAKAPPGMPEPRQGIQTQVLQKQAGKWLIAGFQNTNAIPEQAFPRTGGAPAGSAGERR